MCLRIRVKETKCHTCHRNWNGVNWAYQAGRQFDRIQRWVLEKFYPLQKPGTPCPGCLGHAAYHTCLRREGGEVVAGTRRQEAGRVRSRNPASLALTTTSRLPPVWRSPRAPWRLLTACARWPTGGTSLVASSAGWWGKWPLGSLLSSFPLFLSGSRRRQESCDPKIFLPRTTVKLWVPLIFARRCQMAVVRWGKIWASTIF